MKKDNLYDMTDIHLHYDESRRLPDKTLRLWLDTISRYLPKESIGTIIDLGCGTGRFVESLSTNFSAKVYGIDPSQKMLLKAKEGVSLPSIEFLQGMAEDIPLNNGVTDLIFLSMVYHHLKDRYKAICEFKRVLKKSGLICIRTSTVDSMDSYIWMRFFPNAHQIELARAPSRKGLIDIFQTNGFELNTHTIVHQLFAENPHEYVQKIGLRGLSSLKAITDDEFQNGLVQLKQYCREQETEEAIYEEIDLFIFNSK